ncbi:hypothetical protein P691DRAFT_844550 [Macrolepiota fuliginosa MF-IS2]|uniref:Uncharacterized protein n=1 Tax=Macrolepiota fuliginosa MF-IS2 TaxID=1400762 RepID=A0A9P6BYX9_9AGAR|nr:hypothetical protein P691DRAFT_844550 [Macrolepiota fuliginosa MF-IS2]
MYGGSSDHDYRREQYPTGSSTPLFGTQLMNEYLTVGVEQGPRGDSGLAVYFHCYQSLGTAKLAADLLKITPSIQFKKLIAVDQGCAVLVVIHERKHSVVLGEFGWRCRLSADATRKQERRNSIFHLDALGNDTYRKVYHTHALCYHGKL